MADSGGAAGGKVARQLEEDMNLEKDQSQFRTIDDRYAINLAYAMILRNEPVQRLHYRDSGSKRHRVPIGGHWVALHRIPWSLLAIALTVGSTSRFAHRRSGQTSVSGSHQAKHRSWSGGIRPEPRPGVRLVEATVRVRVPGGEPPSARNRWFQVVVGVDRLPSRSGCPRATEAERGR
jgi:hypothetical protein